MKKLYAHYDKKSDEGQELCSHLRTAAEKGSGKTELLEFSSFSAEEIKSLFYHTGYYHDIGKAMDAFQNYLSTGTGGMEKNHSVISAAVYQSVFKETDDRILVFLATLAIARHHSNLTSQLDTSGYEIDTLEYKFQEIMKNRDSLFVPALRETEFSSGDFVKFNRRGGSKIRNSLSDQHFFLLQMLFSSLIRADKLDAAGIRPKKSKKTGSLKDIDAYIRQKNSGKTPDINDKRSRMKAEVLSVIQQMSDDELKENRIFLLPAPTGSGKTLTSASAAILLRDRLEQIYGHTPKIIAAQPYINILEQTADEYAKIFGGVLVYYSGSEFDDKKSELSLKDKMLISDAWEDDIIITTFVQLFESIITSKNSRLLKLDSLCGSIVILDEVQALPQKYYSLLGAVIKRLSDCYNVRFILMTATQPEIIAAAEKVVGPFTAVPLLKNPETYFEDLHRTKIISKIDELTDSDSLVQFICEVRENNPNYRSVLVVTNTIAQSIELYEKLSEYGQTLYLSTNIIRPDRKAVIEKAKKLIDAELPFTLVSTQAIEAGVDLDFDVGFRDLAPLESIIQVAGRVNRSGEKGDYRPLYLFNTGTDGYVYKFFNLELTKSQLGREIPEEQYKSLCDAYYKALLTDGESDQDIYQAMLELDYGKKSEKEKRNKIDDFTLIEKEGRYRNVLIEKDDSVTKLIQDYCRMIHGNDFSFEVKAELKKLMRRINQYVIAVSENRLKENPPVTFRDLYGIDLDFFVVPKNQLDEYYDTNTGYIFKSSGMKAY